MNTLKYEHLGDIGKYGKMSITKYVFRKNIQLEDILGITPFLGIYKNDKSKIYKICVWSQCQIYRFWDKSLTDEILLKTVLESHCCCDSKTVFKIFI